MRRNIEGFGGFSSGILAVHLRGVICYLSGVWRLIAGDLALYCIDRGNGTHGI